MVKMVDDQPLDVLQEGILTLLRDHPAGLTVAEIEEALSGQLSRRSLQRRLLSLKEKNEIISQGEKKGTRYFLATQGAGLTLSLQGQRLKAKVREPIQKRKPIAYQPDFLLSYEPDTTYYLTAEMRDHLRKIGTRFEHDITAGTYVKKILNRLLIDLSWNSSRLEGNTYSLLETERLIQYGADAEGKEAFEAQMIINHKEAIEFMVRQAELLDFTDETVLNVHALLSNNLLANPNARGQLRLIPVSIGKTVYQPPEIPQLTKQYFEALLSKSRAIKDPFEQAFFVMVQLPYLQPFEDVNKRVSRLIANVPFIKNNLVPLSFIDVPKDDYISGLLAVYELNKIELMRDVFMWAYERSAQHYQVVQDTLGQPNLINMKYKKELTVLIYAVIENNMQGHHVLKAIELFARESIPTADQNLFVRSAERELASLHPGNLAVYQIALSKFEKWRTHH